MAVISSKLLAEKMGVDEPHVQHLVKKMSITKIGLIRGPKLPKVGEKKALPGPFTCDEDAFQEELESITAARISITHEKKVSAGKKAGATRAKKKAEVKTKAKAKAKKTPPKKKPPTDDAAE